MILPVAQAGFAAMNQLAYMDAPWWTGRMGSQRTEGAYPFGSRLHNNLLCFHLVEQRRQLCSNRRHEPSHYYETELLSHVSTARVGAVAQVKLTGELHLGKRTGDFTSAPVAPGSAHG